MDIILSKDRVSRKEHQCDYCGGTIKKGENYHYSKIKGDELYAWKSHLRCEKLTDELNMFDGDCGDGVSQQQFYDAVLCYLQENLTKDEFEQLDVKNSEELAITACELAWIDVD